MSENKASLVIDALRQDQNDVIQQVRLEKLRQAADTVSHYLNAGADPYKRNKLLIKAVVDAASSYREYLYKTALLLSPDDSIKDEMQRLFCGDIGEINEIDYQKINNTLIQDLRKQGKYNNSQSLFLHQIVLVNDILAGIDGMKKQGFLNQFNIFSLLELLSNFDHSSKFILEVGICDPDSYRVFQILNHAAFASFTGVLWDRLIEKHHLDESLKKATELMIESIRPKDNGDAHSEHAEYNSFSMIKEKFFRDTADGFIRNEKIIKDSATKLAKEVFPVFLGVRTDQAELCDLNILICELLEYEQKIGFTLSVDCFESYLNVCFNKHKDRTKKQALQEKLKLYIDRARNARNEREARLINNTELADVLVDEKAQRDKLLVVIDAIRAARIDDLDRLELLTATEKKVYCDFIEQASKLASEEIFSKLEQSQFVTDEIKRLIKDVTADSRVPELVTALTRLAANKAFFVKHCRIAYYTKQLSEAKKQLIDIDKKILARIDVLNDHAKSLMLVEHSNDYVLRDGDHYTSFLSRVINPSPFALTKLIPRPIGMRLSILNQIELSIDELGILSQQCEGIKTDGYDNVNVKKAIGRVTETIAKLKEKFADFELASLTFDLDTLNKSIIRQYKKHKAVNEELLACNKITSKELDRRKYADRARIKNIRDKIRNFKENLSWHSFNRLNKQEFAQEIITLSKAVSGYNQLTNSSYELHENIKIIEAYSNFYSSDPSLKLKAFETPEPYIKDIKNQGWVPWSIANIKKIVKAFNIVTGIYRVLAWVFKLLVTALFIVPAETYKFFSRMRANNKEFIFQVESLRGEIEKILSLGIEIQNNDSSESNNIFVKLDADDAARLKEVVKKLNFIHGKIGRFSYSFLEMRGLKGYKGYYKEVNKLKEKYKNSLSNLHEDSESEVTPEPGARPLTPNTPENINQTVEYGEVSVGSEYDNEVAVEIVNELIGFDKQTATKVINQQAYMHFFRQLNMTLDNKRQLIEAKLTELSGRVEPVVADRIRQDCDKVKAEILQRKRDLAASIGLELSSVEDSDFCHVVIPLDDIKYYDEKLAELDGLQFRLDAQYGGLSKEQAVTILIEKLTRIIHKDKSIIESFSFAVCLGTVNMQSGASISEIAKTVFDEFVSEVFKRLTREELTNSMTVHPNVLTIKGTPETVTQKVFAVARRLFKDFYHDREVQLALDIAIKKGSTSAQHNGNLIDALADGIIEGFRRLIKGQSLAQTIQAEGHADLNLAVNTTDVSTGSAACSEHCESVSQALIDIFIKYKSVIKKTIYAAVNALADNKNLEEEIIKEIGKCNLLMTGASLANDCATWRPWSTAAAGLGVAALGATHGVSQGVKGVVGYVNPFRRTKSTKSNATEARTAIITDNNPTSLSSASNSPSPA